MENSMHKEEFLKGITKLTGLSSKKVTSYAKDNSPFNILQHPMIIDPNEKQLEKIGLLNEFISTYNLLKIYEDQNKMKIDSSSTAGKYFSSLLGGVKDREKFLVSFLDNGNHIIETKVMAEGTVDQAPVYPRDILKAAIATDCAGIIICHNHPGGSNQASRQDKELTQRLVDIFQPLGIKVVDHIIIAGSNYYSMAEKGVIPDMKYKANYEPIEMQRENQWEAEELEI